MNIKVQKIDDSILDIYKIVGAVFSMTDKANQEKFFEKTFLIANINPKIVLRIPFLTLSNVDINFLDWKLR